MRRNLTALIKEELVKRFESVVRDEIQEHKAAVQKSDKDLSEIKALFNEFKKEHDALKQQNLDLYQETQKTFLEEVKRIEKSFEIQNSFIVECREEVSEKLKELKECSDQYIKKDVFLNNLEYMHKCIGEFEKKLHEQNIDLESRLFKKFDETKLEYEEYNRYIKSRIDSCLDQIKSTKEELSTYKIDSAGVLRDLQVYKKTMFILEKKIENIYTLINRLEKRVI